MRWKSTVLACVLPVLFTGCIVSDSTYVELAINEDLSGEIVVEVTGIRSSEDDPKTQKKEFEDYCEEGYLTQGRELASMFAITDPQISLTNRTDTRCELIVQGRFENVVRPLSAMTSEGPFEIRRSDPFLIARFFMPPAKEEPEADADDDNGFTIVVQYLGGIQYHNAHQYDETTGTMTWFASGMDTSGVQFILRLPLDAED